MSENKKTPDLELETLEDDDLKDVAGGVSLQTVMQIGKPLRDLEKSVISGIPSANSDSSFSRNTSGVKK